MQEVFETYSHKNKLYYILQTGTLAFFAFLFIAYKYNLQNPRYLLIAVVVSGISITLINIILTASNPVKMYVVNGELTLSTTEIKINSIIISFKDIKKIVMSAKDYRGARTSDGSGNCIKITDKNNTTTSYNFVISSIDQKNRLKQILETWKEQNVPFEELIF